jgi:hypothetical protein
MRAPAESMNHTIGQRRAGPSAHAGDLLLAGLPMLPPFTVKSYAAAQTMRPSTLPKPQTTASPGGLSLPSGPRRAHLRAVHADLEEHAVVEEGAKRSRAVSLPRSCCFAIALLAAHLTDLRLLASRSFTSSRMFIEISLSGSLPVHRRALLQKRHQPLARVVRREARPRAARGGAGSAASRSRSSCAA